MRHKLSSISISKDSSNNTMTQNKIECLAYMNQPQNFKIKRFNDKLNAVFRSVSQMTKPNLDL